MTQPHFHEAFNIFPSNWERRDFTAYPTLKRKLPVCEVVSDRDTIKRCWCDLFSMQETQEAGNECKARARDWELSQGSVPQLPLQPPPPSLFLTPLL